MDSRVGVMSTRAGGGGADALALGDAPPAAVLPFTAKLTESSVLEVTEESLLVLLWKAPPERGWRALPMTEVVEGVGGGWLTGVGETVVVVGEMSLGRVADLEMVLWGCCD